MNAIKRNIPNTLTCLNLACGCIGIVCLFNGMPKWSVYAMFLAAVFDFLDGFAARLLKVTSPIGRDLDSLADVVTFGLLPGLMMFQLLKVAIIKHFVLGIYPQLDDKFMLMALPFLFIPVFSAIRLAKFNNDPGQAYSFKGLPTPANGLVIASIFYWLITKLPASVFNPAYIENKVVVDVVLNPYLLMAISIILSLLLVSNIPLMALKFKGFAWKANQWKYILLILCLPLIIWLKFASAPFILVLYIIISQIHFRTVKHEI